MSGSNHISYRQPESSETSPEFTGERFIPGVGGQIEVEHVHRYLLARQFAADRDVLDIACGEGYGTELLASVARSVVGVDIDQKTIERARLVHKGPGIRFETGSCLAIPLEDDSIDVLVSFETIEHIADHGAFMTEIRRVLRPGGLLLISTPDPDNYGHDDEGDNPFHVKELKRSEFANLIDKSFAHAIYGAQQCLSGSVMNPLDETSNMTPPGVYRLHSEEMSIEDLGQFGKTALYLVAIATDGVLPKVNWSLLDDPDYAIENVMRLRHDTSLVVRSVHELKKTNESIRSEYEAALTAANSELAAVRRSMVVRIASRLGLVKKTPEDRA
ncbi:MAG: class I SAM-dependent methyltransferase [Phycisphaerales bacterium]|nr:class I SAM-dependent methyltransferase [Phycisphaerales bacterium]